MPPSGLALFYLPVEPLSLIPLEMCAIQKHLWLRYKSLVLSRPFVTVVAVIDLIERSVQSNVDHNNTSSRTRLTSLRNSALTLLRYRSS